MCGFSLPQDIHIYKSIIHHSNCVHNLDSELILRGEETLLIFDKGR